MSKSPIVAAGCVVLRELDGRTQVALVHRPDYDDWSLPKGKVDPGELPPETAVREIHEELGIRVRLGAPLTTVHYQVKSRPKEVRWWVGHALADQELPPIGKKIAHEIDQRAWVDVDEALQRLSYESDIATLQQALEVPTVTPLLLVRHGKAIARKDWSKADPKRPLTPRGEQQSDHLVSLFDAFGVHTLASSSSTRCVQTLEPAADELGSSIERFTELSEEVAESHPKRAADVMDGLASRARTGERIAVCGHRPVLPLMANRLGVEPQAMKTAATRIIYLTNDGVLDSELLDPCLDEDDK